MKHLLSPNFFVKLTLLLISLLNALISRNFLVCPLFSQNFQRNISSNQLFCKGFFCKIVALTNFFRKSVTLNFFQQRVGEYLARCFWKIVRVKLCNIHFYQCTYIKKTAILFIWYRLWKLRNFTATVFSQNFRQINVLQKRNFIVNWFDGKKFTWQRISRFSTLCHMCAQCGE